MNKNFVDVILMFDYASTISECHLNKRLRSQGHSLGEKLLARPWIRMLNVRIYIIRVAYLYPIASNSPIQPEFVNKRR